MNLNYVSDRQTNSAENEYEKSQDMSLLCIIHV